MRQKPFKTSKWEVWKDFRRVKANQGAVGIDGQSRSSRLIERTTSTSSGIGSRQGALIFRRRTAARVRWVFRPSERANMV